MADQVLAAVDPRLIATAFFTRGEGRCRKLMAIMAIGAARGAVDESANLDIQYPVGSPADAQADARERLAELRKILPDGAPDHVALASSRILEERLDDVLHLDCRELPSVQGDEAWISTAKLQMSFLVSKRAPEEAMQRVPSYTNDAPQLDYLLHTALRAGADYVVTNDDRVAPDGGRVFRSLDPEPLSTRAMKLTDFVAAEVDSEDFSLTDLDPDAFEKVIAHVVSR